MEKNLERAKCSVCHEWFNRETDRPEGKLVSCPAHSFGEVEESCPFCGSTSPFCGCDKSI